MADLVRELVAGLRALATAHHHFDAALKRAAPCEAPVGFARPVVALDARECLELDARERWRVLLESVVPAGIGGLSRGTKRLSVAKHAQ